MLKSMLLSWTIMAGLAINYLEARHGFIVDRIGLQGPYDQQEYKAVAQGIIHEVNKKKVPKLDVIPGIVMAVTYLRGATDVDPTDKTVVLILFSTPSNYTCLAVEFYTDEPEWYDTDVNCGILFKTPHIVQSAWTLLEDLFMTFDFEVIHALMLFWKKFEDPTYEKKFRDPNASSEYIYE